jgi:predicted negative regulator of RcsB-dependent stress response
MLLLNFPSYEVSVDRLTRKELKSDRFALEVQHSVEFVSGHRNKFAMYGGIAIALVVVIVGVYAYLSHERSVRQQELHAALLIQNANVGPTQNDYTLSFPTQADRQKALTKAFDTIAAKYSGSDEGVIAQYMLATNAADQGNLTEAEKRLKIVVDSGNDAYGSLAKLSLASIYAGEGKQAEGEKLIQSLIDHPTVMVSKELATISLAQLITRSDPARARKLLEPLRGSPRPNVSKAAITALSDLPQK